MNIDISNIDDLIFSDKRVQKELVEFKSLFDQWLLGIKVPALRFLTQKSRLEMLEKLNTEDNRAILSSLFKEQVIVQPIDYHTVKHYKVSLNEAEKMLGGLSGSVKDFNVSRDRDSVYITIWK